MRRLLFIFLLSFSAHAFSETTGNDLYAQLSSNDASLNLRSYAYIQGVLDSEDWYLTADIYSSIGTKKGGAEKFKIPHICLGNSNITFGQLKDIVLKYLVEHPETRHFRANVLIRFSLLDSFACANNPEVNNARK